MTETLQTLTPAERAAWFEVLGRFEAISRQFDDAVVNLRLQGEIVRGDPVLSREHDGLSRRAASTELRVRAIRSALDDVRAALRGAWDRVTGAWERVRDWVGLSGEIEGLGAVPLIPIAAVLAAIALVASFLTDYAKFSRKVTVYKALVDQGYPPAVASQSVQQMVPDSPWFGINLNPLIWVAAGLVVLWFFKR